MRIVGISNRRMFKLLLLFTCVLPLGVSEVYVAQPFRVIDLHSPGAVDAKVFDRIQSVSQVGPRWAALISTSGASVLVYGDIKSEHRISLDGQYDSVKIDADKSIQLSDAFSRKSETHVEVLNSDGTVRQSFWVPGRAAPLQTGSRVKWDTPRGVLSVGDLRSRLMSSALEPKMERMPRHEATYVFGLPNGRAEVLVFSERVEIYDENNALINSFPLPLNEAFSKIGLPSRPPDLAIGRSRMIWATASTAGDICVGLSETPMSGPLYVAIVDSTTGLLSRVTELELPVRAGRVGTHNEAGRIVPMLAAFGDLILIADPEMGVIALYTEVSGR